MEYASSKKFSLRRTTPVPNQVLDDILPSLKDTELRVLLVVIRMTLGWAGENGTRKDRDWLTHGQLKRRTGRASAAVCSAVDGLVNKGLIEVLTESGAALTTPQARRRHLGHLFYRLHPAYLGANVSREPAISKRSFHKVKTTKEKGTKENQVGILKIEVAPVTEAFEDTEEKVASVQTFVAVFLKNYLEHRPGTTPPPVTEADLRLLRRRLKQYSAADLEARIPVFFATSLDYTQRYAYSLASFLNTLAILQAIRRRP